MMEEVTKPKKKINSNAKGYRNQKKTELYLIERGFRVDSAKYSRWGSTDYFNLWDHIAVALKDTEINSKAYKRGSVVFVQTKSNVAPTGKVLAKYNDSDFENRIIFVWKDREKEPRIKIMEEK